MNVVLTETLKLMMVNLPFTFFFSSGNKNQGNQGYNHWFTPSGICRIYFGGCHVQHRGRYNQDDEKKMVNAMKKYKCDILTDGRDYYTIANDCIGMISNMDTIIRQATEEWEALKDRELWEDKKEYVEGTKTIDL